MTMIDVSHVTMQFNMANDKIISLKETVVALLRGKLKYKKFTALDDVSFSVESGEKLGIIGESGSGKTTVVNMITRLLDVSSGTIRLDGEDITLKKGKELKEVYKKMQMVFQTPTESFDPRRKLGDGIAESLINYGMKKKEAIGYGADNARQRHPALCP